MWCVLVLQLFFQSLSLVCWWFVCVCICVYSGLASEEGDSFFSHLFGWGASGFCMLLAKRSESHLPISLCLCVSVCVAGCGGSNTFSSCVRCVHHTLTMFMYFLLSFYSLSRHHLLIAYSTAILYLPKCWCSFAWFFFWSVAKPRYCKTCSLYEHYVWLITT